MNHLPVLLILFPLFGSMFAALAIFARPVWSRSIVLISLLATLATAIATFAQVASSGTWHYELGGWAAPWGIEYVVDTLSAGMAILLSLMAFLVGIFGQHSLKKAFSPLYLLLLTGLLGMVVTGDLFNFYVFLEISALSAYALLSSGGDRAVVAVFRYVLVGTIGASFFLLGLGYLYAATGTLNMADLALRIPAVGHSTAITAGIVLMIVGLCIKTAVFPLHSWLPDVYTYAPFHVTAFVSAVMTKVSAYAIFRILFTVFQGQNAAQEIFAPLGVAASLGILAGSIMALTQNDVRRMLAYSSVAQLGYIVLGFAIGTPLAITGALFHVFAHAIMKGSLFMIAGNVHRKTKGVKISDYVGLSKSMPWTAAAFVVIAFSMMGLPPTAGFFSKWYLIRGAMDAHLWIYVGVMAVGSLLTATYFFRVIEAMYLQKAEAPLGPKESPFGMLAPVLFLALAVLLLGFFNQFTIDMVIPLTFSAGG